MKPKWVLVLLTWLVTGTLDILCATLFLSKTQNLGKVLRTVAGGLVGSQSVPAGIKGLVLGAGIHYFFALWWTTLFLALYHRWHIHKLPAWVTILGFGFIIHLCMSFIILPLLSTYPAPSMSGIVPILKNGLILSFAFGLPLWYVGKKYFV